MTGEMSYIDEETGLASDGNTYDTHAKLRKELLYNGYRATLRPFDSYRGPYILVSAYGFGFKIWLGEFLIVESSNGDKKFPIPASFIEGDYERVVQWLKKVLVPDKKEMEREFTADELKFLVIHLPTGKLIAVGGEANREPEDWPHCLEIRPSGRYQSISTTKEIPKPLEKDCFDSGDVGDMFTAYSPRHLSERRLVFTGFLENDTDYAVFQSEEDDGLYVFYKGEEIDCTNGCKKTGSYLVNENEFTTEVCYTWERV